jgi:hypothetical protein
VVHLANLYASTVLGQCGTEVGIECFDYSKNIKEVNKSEAKEIMKDEYFRAIYAFCSGPLFLQGLFEHLMLLACVLCTRGSAGESPRFPTRPP